MYLFEFEGFGFLHVPRRKKKKGGNSLSRVRSHSVGGAARGCGQWGGEAREDQQGARQRRQRGKIRACVGARASARARARGGGGRRRGASSAAGRGATWRPAGPPRRSFDAYQRAAARRGVFFSEEVIRICIWGAWIARNSPKPFFFFGFAGSAAAAAAAAGGGRRAAALPGGRQCAVAARPRAPPRATRHARREGADGGGGSREGRARRDLLLVAFCFVDVFAAGLAIGAVGPQMKEMGLGPATAGAVGSVYGTLQLASGPLAGWASDVFGRRAVLCGSCAGISLGYAHVRRGGRGAGTAGGAHLRRCRRCRGRTASTLAVGLRNARVVTGTSKHRRPPPRRAPPMPPAARPAGRALLGRMNMGASLGYMVSPLLGAHMHSATARTRRRRLPRRCASRPRAPASPSPDPRAAGGPVAEVSGRRIARSWGPCAALRGC